MSKKRIITFVLSAIIGTLGGYALAKYIASRSFTNKDVAVQAWCDKIVSCDFLPHDKEDLCITELTPKAKEPSDADLKGFLTMLNGIPCEQFAMVLRRTLQ